MNLLQTMHVLSCALIHTYVRPFMLCLYMYIHTYIHVATFPDEEQAMSLAAPAIAIANQSIPMAHTAPLLPTPPTVNSVLTAAGITPTPQIPGVQVGLCM